MSDFWTPEFTAVICIATIIGGIVVMALISELGDCYRSRLKSNSEKKTGENQ